MLKADPSSLRDRLKFAIIGLAQFFSFRLSCIFLKSAALSLPCYLLLQLQLVNTFSDLVNSLVDKKFIVGYSSFEQTCFGTSFLWRLQW